jgi:glycosyltransferase involved in cell wall biosynthesis
MMKTAFVSTMSGLPWGGSEELWSRSAMRMCGLGHAVACSVAKWDQRHPAIENLEACGARMNFRALHKPMLRRLTERIFSRNLPRNIDLGTLRWLKSFQPDLVVISQGGPWEGLSWMNACREAGHRYAVVVHAHDESWWPLDSWACDLRNGLEAAESVYFVSNANLRLMELQCGMELVNAEVISNPWNVAHEFELADLDAGGTVRFACVGRLDPRAKGQDLVLQLMAMRKWKGRDVEVNFHGTGPYLNNLERMAKMCGAANVNFIGQTEDVRGIWEHHHGLLMASRYEGLPLAIVEAQLCGRIVVATDVAGISEHVRDGVDGFIAEAPTIRHLDAALERAWQVRGDWSMMGKASRERLKSTIPQDPVGDFVMKLGKLVAA